MACNKLKIQVRNWISNLLTHRPTAMCWGPPKYVQTNEVNKMAYLMELLSICVKLPVILLIKRS